MTDQQMRTPNNSVIKKLGESQSRFKLFKEVFKRFPLGTSRVYDVEGVGPANVDMCKSHCHNGNHLKLVQRIQVNVKTCDFLFWENTFVMTDVLLKQLTIFVSNTAGVNS